MYITRKSCFQIRRMNHLVVVSPNTSLKAENLKEEGKAVSKFSKFNSLSKLFHVKHITSKFRLMSLSFGIL